MCFSIFSAYECRGDYQYLYVTWNEGICHSAIKLCVLFRYISKKCGLVSRWEWHWFRQWWSVTKIVALVKISTCKQGIRGICTSNWINSGSLMVITLSSADWEINLNKLEPINWNNKCRQINPNFKDSIGREKNRFFTHFMNQWIA